MRRKIESSEAQIEMAADVEEDDAFDAMLPACTKSAFSIKRASSIVSLCSKGEVAFGARECGRWQHAESEAPKAEPQAAKAQNREKTELKGSNRKAQNPQHPKSLKAQKPLKP